MTRRPPSPPSPHGTERASRVGPSSLFSWKPPLGAVSPRPCHPWLLAACGTDQRIRVGTALPVASSWQVADLLCLGPRGTRHAAGGGLEPLPSARRALGWGGSVSGRPLFSGAWRISANCRSEPWRASSSGHLAGQEGEQAPCRLCLPPGRVCRTCVSHYSKK